MEQSYSVGTTNRYAMLFDEEDDPGDVISPASNKQEKEGTTKPVKGGKELSKQTKQAKNTVKGKENKEKTAQKQNKVVVLESVNKSKCEPRLDSMFSWCVTVSITLPSSLVLNFNDHLKLRPF